MLRFGVFCLLSCLSVSALWAGEPEHTTRPISDADSVLAVYYEAYGRPEPPPGDAAPGDTPPENLTIILGVWPDGHIVWSGDRLEGGAPYRVGRVDPKKVTALLSRFDADGLFADENQKFNYVVPDGPYVTVFIKSGKKKVTMCSCRELFEESGELVAESSGVGSLNGRHRLDVLRKAPADHLYFRFVWNETRARLSDLIPPESSVIAGRIVMKGGAVSWQEAKSGPLTKEEAIRIAEAEVRKWVPPGTKITVRSTASHYEPGDQSVPPWAPNSAKRQGGWAVTVFGVPGGAGQRRTVFVSDSGTVAGTIEGD